MIKMLKLQNFTVFKEANLEFSPGLNVIIGENGTGKSHLLKLGYAILQGKADELHQNANENVKKVVEELDKKASENYVHVFLNDTIIARLIYTFNCKKESILRNGSKKKKFSINATITQHKNFSSLFIPTKEVLSIYKGFRSTLKNRELAFDGTYLDLAEALDLPPFKGDRLADVRPLFEPLEKILHARVEQENGEFFFAAQGEDEEKNGNRIHAQLAAEGHRKLGMLSYLIKNGSLRKGTSLFWDEPEANLNPRLLAKLAVILVELSKIMQVTIATHSLFLLRELEILQEKQQLRDARYFGLHFAEDGGVEIQQGDNSNDIGDIAALDANVEQSTRYLQMDEDF